MKFYVLTTRNMKCLKRHTHPRYSAIQKEDLVVVINTLDAEYESQAKQWCVNEGVEYHITESNGTAARGKNCVLDVFMESDNDYFVLIDGDDYLTQHGVWMYKAVAQQESPPDVIVLKEQIALVWDRELVNTWLKRIGADQDNLKLGEVPEEYVKVKPHKIFKLPSDNNCDDSKDGWNGIISGLTADQHLSKAAKMELITYYSKQMKYSESGEAHCRVTWCSKKAAVHRYREHLSVGEDTIYFYVLKNEQYHGRLTVLCNVENPPTYVYDTSNPGVVCEVGEFGTNNMKWVIPFNEEMRSVEREMILHNNYNLPELEVDYPPDYDPEVFSISPNHLWDVEVGGGVVCRIEHPANCSAKSLEDKYNMTKTE